MHFRVEGWRSHGGCLCLLGLGGSDGGTGSGSERDGDSGQGALTNRQQSICLAKVKQSRSARAPLSARQFWL